MIHYYLCNKCARKRSLRLNPHQTRCGRYSRRSNNPLAVTAEIKGVLSLCCFTVARSDLARHVEKGCTRLCLLQAAIVSSIVLPGDLNKESVQSRTALNMYFCCAN